MNDMPDAPAPEGTALDGKTIADLAEQLNQLLRLRTFPIGMKLFADVAEMEAVPGLRRPAKGKTYSTCQLVTQSRMAGFTLGITTENVPPFSSCSSVIGLDAPGDIYLSGRKMDGVWFENRDAAAAHQAQMPRVTPGTYNGLAISPLRTGRLSPPDVCLFYGNPAQMILFINGLQWRNYQRYDFSITGESACADSWGSALEEPQGQPVDPVLRGAPLWRRGRRRDADGLPARRPATRGDRPAGPVESRPALPDHAVRSAGRTRRGHGEELRRQKLGRTKKKPSSFALQTAVLPWPARRSCVELS